MLLCIDIGNTNTVVGGFTAPSSDQLQFEYRFASDVRRTVDEYQVVMMASLKQSLSDAHLVDRVIIASVVPQLTQVFVDLVRRCFSLEAELVGPGIKTGLALNVSEPASVGADRVVNSLALKMLYGYPGIVIDFGTATSFDYINASGCYEGGIIAPGLAGALEALVRNTAKLPRIELKWPKSVIGKGTISAMQSGTMVGYACLVDGLVEKIIAEVGDLKYIIATGGLGEIFVQHCRMIKQYDRNLTLQGLRLIAGFNETS